MKQQLLNVLTTEINRCLKQGDPHALEQLHTLNGTGIAFVLLPFTLKWHWRVDEGRMMLDVNSEVEPNGELRGSVFAFLRAMNHANPSSVLQQGDLTLHGDVHVVEKWFAFFKQIDMDWEAYLSEYVGDFFSVRLMSGLRSFREVQRKKVDDVCDDLEHYVKHEKGWFPSVDDVRKFLDEVDELSLAEARLSARFARLGV